MPELNKVICSDLSKMVSENAEMSLDDFIAKNKIKGSIGKGGRGGRDRQGGRGNYHSLLIISYDS